MRVQNYSLYSIVIVTLCIVLTTVTRCNLCVDSIFYICAGIEHIYQMVWTGGRNNIKNTLKSLFIFAE